MDELLVQNLPALCERNDPKEQQVNYKLTL